MKIICIGDIHGRNTWVDIVNKHKDPGDIVVFIGDYLDSWDVPIESQVENFKKILEYKKLHKEECVLLLGNHDFQYLGLFKHERYGGFSPRLEKLAQPLLKEAIEKDLIQIAFAIKANEGQVLFTHAGVSKVWLKRAGISFEDGNIEALTKAIQDCFKNNPKHFCFAVGAMDPTGDDPVQSPIWIRPDSLEEYRIPGVSQVVGHTMVSTIRYTQTNPIIAFIDSLHNREFLMLYKDGAYITKI